MLRSGTQAYSSPDRRLQSPGPGLLAFARTLSSTAAGAFSGSARTRRLWPSGVAVATCSTAASKMRAYKPVSRFSAPAEDLAYIEPGRDEGSR